MRERQTEKGIEIRMRAGSIGFRKEFEKEDPELKKVKEFINLEGFVQIIDVESETHSLHDGINTIFYFKNFKGLLKVQETERNFILKLLETHLCLSRRALVFQEVFLALAPGVRELQLQSFSQTRIL